MFNKSYRVIELLIDEERNAILESVSLVDRPAIDRDFMYFSKEKPKYYFSEEEQRIVVGPAMIPDMKIARKDDDGEIYYVYFSKDTIQKAAELFLKYDRASAQNTDHRDNFNNEVYLMESWIIEDEYDKAFTKYGFSKLPIGTWMCKMRVMDDKVWAEVKDGKYKGFSVQGDFIFGKEKYEKAFAAYKRKYKGVRNKWKKLYEGLTQEEKLQLDQILFLVEMNETDVFETPEMAIQRSKELGLRGEIHSHFDEELKILIYMPGASHEDYEKAIEVNEVKDEYEWDINALPSYVEEKRKKQDFAKVSFDWDDTLSTERGKKLLEEKLNAGDTIYIISARQEVSDTMKAVAQAAGIPLDRVFATGSNKAKIEKIKELAIDKHIDNNADVVKELGAIGQQFVTVSPGESKDEYIGRCMSSLQGEYPSEDQRYAVCITEWEGSAQEINMASYPWDQCISDRLGEGKSQESAERICGWIKANQ